MGVFIDGFDHYSDAAATPKWDASSTFVTQTGVRVLGYGRAANCGSLLPALYGVKTLASPAAAFVAGFHFQCVSASNENPVLFAVVDDASTQIQFRYNTQTEKVTILRGSTVVATSVGTLPKNAWAWCSVKVVVNGTTGVAELYVNGTSFVTFAGDTAESANNYANKFQIGSGASNVNLYYDNFVIAWDEAAPLNDHVSEGRVYFGVPASDGDTTSFAPSTGSDNYAVVDEIPPNGDTDYNSSATPGAKDLFGMTAFTGISAAVLAVQLGTYGKKTDTGVRVLRHKMKVGGTEYVFGADFAPTVGYAFWLNTLTADPSTASAWGVTNIENAQWGYELVS